MFRQLSELEDSDQDFFESVIKVLALAHNVPWQPKRARNVLQCSISNSRKEFFFSCSECPMNYENSVKIIVCLYNIVSEQGQMIYLCLKVNFTKTHRILILNLKCHLRSPLQLEK